MVPWRGGGVALAVGIAAGIQSLSGWDMGPATVQYSSAEGKLDSCLYALTGPEFLAKQMRLWVPSTISPDDLGAIQALKLSVIQQSQQYCWNDCLTWRNDNQTQTPPIFTEAECRRAWNKEVN